MNVKTNTLSGVTVDDSDSRGVLTFDLRDILRLIPKSIDSCWELLGVEAMGGAAAEALHTASDSGTRLDGVRLAELASGVSQVIDGEFRAFESRSDEPWLIIRAVDSVSYDVISSDSTVLEKVRRHFGSVRDYPTEELP